MSPAIIEILVLAGIAIFLVLRLKNVLGTREGFEKPPLQDAPPWWVREVRSIPLALHWKVRFQARQN